LIAEDVDDAAREDGRQDGRGLARGIIEARIDADRPPFRHLPEHGEGVCDDRDPEDAEEKHDRPEAPQFKGAWERGGEPGVSEEQGRQNRNDEEACTDCLFSADAVRDVARGEGEDCVGNADHPRGEGCSAARGLENVD